MQACEFKVFKHFQSDKKRIDNFRIDRGKKQFIVHTWII